MATWFVTRAARGLGFAIAQHALAAGDNWSGGCKSAERSRVEVAERLVSYAPEDPILCVAAHSSAKDNWLSWKAAAAR